uniref:Uncharacterized protein n=1 Tax=Panstrongylus lignarius TaxID=156445 RepID=A0A224XZP6_9HEMI
MIASKHFDANFTGSMIEIVTYFYFICVLMLCISFCDSFLHNKKKKSVYLNKHIQTNKKYGNFTFRLVLHKYSFKTRIFFF